MRASCCLVAALATLWSLDRAVSQTATTYALPEVCVPKRVNYYYNTSYDVRKKYSVPNPDNCCEYCRTQSDCTAWSWSVTYQTCICQNPGIGDDLRAISNYYSGCFNPSCMQSISTGTTSTGTTSTGTTSTGTTSTGTTSTGTTAVDLTCPIQKTGFYYNTTYDVRKKYSVPNPDGCCAYCRTQSDCTAWSWSVTYLTCICQNPGVGDELRSDRGKNDESSGLDR
eukprot:TRINITY_DN1284_c0_g1_i4.p1 TRINITY_DN1284_c0_g1~~TRINITY_DN1284_c0_g1_i4.p1  ORF type:complete len:225 (+),score=52.88 TRINITY_DN1284_c0_g1_i4:123-797(+)